MKMVKSLLLGSAAGIVAIAGAQAADLPVKAAPVQYVKICTLYGDGFYYIPGSDTCIKFGGYVRADYNWNGRRVHIDAAGSANDRSVNRWTTRHRANLTTDTRTQTAYGTLRTYVSLNAEVAETVATLGTHRAFIQWGGFTFGRTVSFTDHEGSLGDSGMRSLWTGILDGTTGAAGINQIAYTWQLGNGITLNVGADDPRNKSIINASVTNFTAGTDPASARHGTSHPDPWVALRINQAWGRASVAVIGHNNQASYYNNTGGACTAGNTGTTLCGYPDDKWGWAVLAGTEIKLDMLSPGSRLGLYGTYGVGASGLSRNGQISAGLFGSGNEIAFSVLSDAIYTNGSQMELTTTWAFGGGFEYFWTRNFSSTVYGGYTVTEYNTNGAALICSRLTFSGTCDPNFNVWGIGTHHDWFPLPGLRFAVDAMYTGVDTAFSGQTVAIGSAGTTLRTIGNRPTGAYLAKDLGIWTVAFRAQRTWGGGD